MDVSGREENAVRNAQILLGLAVAAVLMLVGFPALLSLLFGVGIGYITINSAIQSHWDSIRREIEKDIPTLLRNLAGVLHTERNPLDAMIHAVQAVDDNRPLHPWVMYVAEEVRSGGIGAFERLRAEAFEISSALGVVFFEVERMMQTGGSGYMEAFLNAADNLSGLIEVRGEAYTEVSRAYGLVRVIIGLAVFIYASLLSSPSGRDILLGTLQAQLMLGGSVVWAVIGWMYIRSKTQEVTA